jgi:sarcosine oxidase delta subunit
LADNPGQPCWYSWIHTWPTDGCKSFFTCLIKTVSTSISDPYKYSFSLMQVYTGCERYWRPFFKVGVLLWGIG